MIDRNASVRSPSPSIDQPSSPTLSQRLTIFVGRDLVREVTCKEPYHWNEGPWNLEDGYQPRQGDARFRVIAYDFGIKRNILRNLVGLGCDVTVVPADSRPQRCWP